MANKHRCAAIGCARLVPDNMLMCSEHWFKVPKTLRDRVWRLYKQRGYGTPGAEELHRIACLDAVAALQRSTARDQECQS
jgi:hypothetical protein